MMTGQYKSVAEFAPTDFRQILPRFSNENFTANLHIQEQFESVAAKHNATTGQITLAWIRARHPDFVSIPGSRDAKRVEENAGAAYLQLEEEDMSALNEVVEKAEVKGARYPASLDWLANRDTIPLSEWEGEDAV